MSAALAAEREIPREIGSRVIPKNYFFDEDNSPNTPTPFVVGT